MATIVQVATQILERFCLEAGSKTNQQLSVPHTLEQLCLLPEDAEAALRYLEERALVNRFGPEIIYLGARGVQAHEEAWDLEQLNPVARTDEDEASEDLPPDEEPPPEEEDDRPAAPILTHIDLDGEQYSISLGWVCSIGRAPDNNVHISDKRASKHHAVLRYQDGHYVLEDKDSANGTLLNGAYVTEQLRLRHNDEIVIGRTLLLFQEPATISDPGGVPPEELLSEGPARHASAHAQPPTERPYELNPPSEAASVPPSTSDASIPPFPPPDSEVAGLPSFSPSSMSAPAAFDPFDGPPSPQQSITPGTDPSLLADEVPKTIEAMAPKPRNLRAAEDAEKATQRLGRRDTTEPRPFGVDPDRTLPSPPASIPEGLRVPQTHTLDVEAHAPARSDSAAPPSNAELLRLAESLPQAPVDLDLPPSDPPLRLPPDFADDPFFLTLRTIRSQLPPELHNRQGLVDAIDLLVHHPFVQIVIERLGED